MPELPEAETVAKGLAHCLTGKRVESVTAFRKSLRKELDLAALRRAAAGARVEGVDRRGKAVLVRLDSGYSLLVQLGMTGVCRVCPKTEPRGRHEHVAFAVAGGLEWRFADIRRFGMIEAFATTEPETWPEFLRKLGPEPLGREFSAKYLRERAAGCKREAKLFLLDQEVVAGIGNIYDSEILYRARVHPARRAETLSAAECGEIVKATRRVLREAIRAGGTTISDYRLVDGNEGKFARRLRVYGRAGEKCADCGSAIEKIEQGGRSSFFCPRCQK